MHTYQILMHNIIIINSRMKRRRKIKRDLKSNFFNWTFTYIHTYKSLANTCNVKPRSEAVMSSLLITNRSDLNQHMTKIYKIYWNLRSASESARPLMTICMPVKKMFCEYHVEAHGMTRPYWETWCDTRLSRIFGAKSRWAETSMSKNLRTPSLKTQVWFQPNVARNING